MRQSGTRESVKNTLAYTQKLDIFNVEQTLLKSEVGVPQDPSGGLLILDSS